METGGMECEVHTHGNSQTDVFQGFSAKTTAPRFLVIPAWLLSFIGGYKTLMFDITRQHYSP